MTLFWAGILLLAAGGVAQFLLPQKLKAACVALFSFCAAAALCVPAAGAVLSGASRPLWGGGVLAPFAMDPLSGFFTVIISVMGFLGTLFACGYMKNAPKENSGSHYFFLALLLASMILTVTARDALYFLVAWEIMSLSSFFLVIYENEKKEALDAGIYYLVAMHVSVLFIMAGFAGGSLLAGNFHFAAIEAATKGSGAATIIFVLLFAGFAIKAGFVPFHTWLPVAHPAAPSHVSGLMSGVMIKIGIYGILRALTVTGIPGPAVSYGVLAIGAVSALLGILYAIAQQDIKRTLAYSSVENIGIIGIGIGLGMLGINYANAYMAFLGFAGALMHAFNHSVFKELLFYGAGAVYSATHTREMDALGGLAKKMPLTAFYFLIGAMAITALPLFNGFAGEFTLYMAMTEGVKIKSAGLLFASAAAMAALAFAGAMALMCFAKVFSVVFLGSARSKKARIEPGEERAMLAPMAILSLLCVVIGIFPQHALSLASKPAAYMMESLGFSLGGFTPVYNAFSKMSVMFIIIAATAGAVWLVKMFLLSKKSAQAPTWGCGYTAPNSRMQYTGTSFASPFLKLSGPAMKQETLTEKPEGLFPKKASFKIISSDIFEAYVIRPLSSVPAAFFKLFSWIQSGNMQQYILYGIIFLVLSIFLIVGGWM